MNPELTRIREQIKEVGDVRGQASSGFIPRWEKWGPYVSERGWGTVREDYSENGDAWNYFPHAHAHMRAYRRCEDGIAGISDRFQILLFAPVFWNGKDPILKERLFGLNCFEGNHGEDVKEIYYHLDATPTYTYLKYLYKYPQARYPFEDLVLENQKRGAEQREYELIDTGIFNEDRYFDLFIEYAKADQEDICIRIEAINRGPDPAPLHVLPHLWFRNQWAWEPNIPQPIIQMGGENYFIADDRALPSLKYLLFDYHLGPIYLYATPGSTPLFCGNDTNMSGLWNQPNPTPYVKDAFHRYLIHKEIKAVNPKKQGTKAAFHFFFDAIAPGKSQKVLLRLTKKKMDLPLQDIEKVIQKRKEEADLFY
ncbi:MAG: glucosidase, partial [Chlamydiae bacterium]|nr:glucosidase [Chlamydiota bacterium]